MKHKDRIIVSAILLTTDKKILLGRTRKGGVYDDCWHIPGGGVEPGESMSDALKREVMEEVGIDISGKETRLVFDKDSAEAVKTNRETGEEFLVTMHFNDYLIELGVSSENVGAVLSDDIVSFTWAPLASLKDYKLTPPSIKLFKVMGWI